MPFRSHYFIEKNEVKPPKRYGKNSMGYYFENTEEIKYFDSSFLSI